jgi:hypothetical protein
MKNLWTLCLFLMITASASFADEIHLIGTVRDAQDGSSLSQVLVKLKSGKIIAQTNEKGTFECDVANKNTILVFEKTGFSSRQIPIAEWNDYFDIQVSLNSQVKVLDQSITSDQSQKGPIQKTSPFQIAAIEKKTGYVLDINDHLSTIAGISQSQEFSSLVSYDGSKMGDVKNSINGLIFPNWRHLDFGFPGNLSAINPQNLGMIQVENQSKNASFSAGNGSQIALTPHANKREKSEIKTNWSGGQSELNIQGPLLGSDNFIFSIRRLNDFYLKNLGEKFFTKYTPQSEACVSDCLTPRTNEFDLSAGDLWISWQGSDSVGNKTNITAFGLWDQWQVAQDTTTGNSLDGAKINQFRGSQFAHLYSWGYSAVDGFLFSLAYASNSQEKELRNLKSFSNVEGDTKNLMSNLNDQDQRISSKIEYPWTFGPAWENYLVTEYHILTNTRKEKVISSDLIKAKAQQIDLGLKLLNQSDKNTYYSSIGAEALIDQKSISPILSLGYERANLFNQKMTLGSELAAKSQSDLILESYGKTQWTQTQNLLLNSFLKWNPKSWTLEMRGFFRLVKDPVLPESDALWFYTQNNQERFAWVNGGALSGSWRNQNWIISSNINSTYGEYENGLPWDANRTLETMTRVRYFPRTDSLVGLTLVHRIQLGTPLYSYALDTNLKTKAVYSFEQDNNHYRTDIKLDLALASQLKPLKNVRFFFELDNIFSGLDIVGLGSQNPRSRGWQVDANRNTLQLNPFIGQGMGFFAQFGVEGTFGF